MRIAIDSRIIIQEHQIETFRFFSLFRTLIKIEPEWQWFLCIPHEGKCLLEKLAPDLVPYAVIIPWGGGLFNREVSLVKSLTDLKAHVYHFFQPDIPYMFFGKSTLTLSSLSSYFAPNPENSDSFSLKYQSYRLERSLKKAAHVFMDSQELFRLLQEFPDFSRQNSSILPSISLFPHHTHSRPSKKIVKSDIPYIYSSNGVNYGSNLLHLLEAFAKVREQFSLEFYISGEENTSYTEVRKKIVDLSLVDVVHLVGPVTLKDHESYLRHASAFINISFAETYNAPFLDAIDCGVPIIAGKHLSEQGFLSESEYHVCSLSQEDSITEAILAALIQPKNPNQQTLQTLSELHNSTQIATELLHQYQLLA